MTALSPSLPPLPEKMRALPVDARGYPVPWFVEWMDVEGRSVPRGQGTPDFRIMSSRALVAAYNQKLCWVCGGQRGTYSSFVVGPMCAVNRVSAEPPCHLECADFSARACPFLATPARKRREKGMPDDGVQPGGIMLKRNPGVALVYTTKRFEVLKTDNGNGVCFGMHEPEHLRWYCEGRPATRAEVWASIESGLPILNEAARDDEERREIAKGVERVQLLLPTVPL